LARSRKELIFNVSSVFFNILAQKRVVESLEFSRQTLQEHLKQVEALVAAQKAARVDRMRTEVRLADIEQRLVREENVKLIYQRVLVNLLGLKNPSGAISLRGNVAVAQKASTPDLETALAKAWSNRDDFLSARSALEAQARNVDVARAGHWPTLSLQGAYGERWAIRSVSGFGDRSSEVYRIGIAVDIPIFEGGRVEARVRDQRAKLASAQERFRKLDLQIRLDVETALLNVNSSWERIEAIKKAIEQAKESFRIERQKYDLGKGAIVDVLDAQSALLDSQTNYDRALADYNIALAQLRLAIGGEL
jgi:outer membrane protein TolC